MRFFIYSALFLFSGLSIFAQNTKSPIDQNATKQTKNLYKNLHDLAQEHILFGHQDALAYGVEWEDWHKKKSDVYDVSGKYPAVYGWDVSKLGQRSFNIDTVDFKHMQEWMKEVYKMGGINTVSWHMDNFVNNMTSWDVGDNVVATILPGGENHESYKNKLNLFADYINEIQVGFLFKKKVPIIFRPFHEHTGGWFWWGAKWCSPEEYKALWRFTVLYLQDEKGMDQLLWAYSPDIFRDAEHYLEYYPGDEYVDILGFDDYHDVGLYGNIEDLANRLKVLVQLAEEKGKIAALTETGLESIPQQDWWTNKLLYALNKDEDTRKIAWVLVWRNDRKDHHYAPFPGHVSAENFKEFANNPLILFQDRLKGVYK